MMMMTLMMIMMTMMMIMIIIAITEVTVRLACIYTIWKDSTLEIDCKTLHYAEVSR